MRAVAMKVTPGIFILFLFMLQYSCNVVNPSEGIPTYIQIDSVKLLSTMPEKHGSVNHKITDVWVYYNREILGAFELPARVPILATGRGQIQVLAGVYEDGLSGTRNKYPFYNVDTFTFDASPTEQIKHTPIFTYRTADTPAITYRIEDFEQGNIFVKRYNNDTTIFRSNAPGDAFEGDWCGKVVFQDTLDNMECITSSSYFLPPGREAYMELNYKSDVAFAIRTEFEYNTTFFTDDVITLKASSKWNKIYVKLGGFAQAYQGASFKFILKAEKPTDMSTANLYFDNFKIIYFN